MSVYALEHLPSLSTEEILSDIHQDLLPHVAIVATHVESPYINIDEQRREFYVGVNGRLTFLNVLNRVELAYQNVQCFEAHGRPNSDRIELSVGYEYDRHGILRPLPLDDMDSFSVTMSSAHTAKRLRHRPKLWEDGGCSLETISEQPSLDQLSIKRLAEFVTSIADTDLIPVKPRY